MLGPVPGMRDEDRQVNVFRGIAAVVATLACLAAWPVRAEAQQPRRIGVLAPELLTNLNAALDPLRRSLRELGWNEGRDYALVVREHAPDAAAVAAATADLVQAGVDVAVVVALQAALVARSRAPRLPIVTLAGADPVTSGAAVSLARPGGTITGIALMSPELMAKRLQLLKEVVPAISRLAIIQSPDAGVAQSMTGIAAGAAERLGMTVRVFDIRGRQDIDGGFDAAKAWNADALIIMDLPQFYVLRTELASAALQRKLPAACPFPQMARDGCLLAYSSSIVDSWGRAGYFVDRILKGEKAADLPFQQPTRFEFVINLKSAAMLGVEVPAMLLPLADEVIE
jgi:putative ABC transport system substrate-binding protein